jgi:sensor histidine kinase regulating citrate/malate metabolism
MDFITLFWIFLLAFGAGFAGCWFLRVRIEKRVAAVEAKAQAVRDAWVK